MTLGTGCKNQESDSLEKLRERMKGVLEQEMYEDDYLLLRFLKARDFNIDNAEAMLRKHVEWREKHDIKNMLKFQKPEVCEKYVPYIVLGYDKEGCLVRYSPVGNIDCSGLNSSLKFDDLAKYMLYETEVDTLELKNQSRKLGRNIDKCVYVYSLDNLTFAQATEKRNLHVLLYAADFFQNNYPERLKAAFLINSSLYFSFIFNMMKPFLAKSIIEKIHIYSDDSYKEDLLKVIDADVLPAFLGGTRTDPDGNPLCNTFINPGGPIPETYYLQKNKKSLAKVPGVEKVTLPRAAFHEVILEIKEPNSYLEWAFETKCRDIGFGLFYQRKEGDEETNDQIIPIHRIDTEISAETGTFKCDKMGTYVLVFDNTYSWIRSKEIFYHIKVLTSKEHEVEMTKRVKCSD